MEYIWIYHRISEALEYIQNHMANMQHKMTLMDLRYT